MHVIMKVCMRPGSSKWPRLDPRVTFSVLKRPPFGVCDKYMCIQYIYIYTLFTKNK